MSWLSKFAKERFGIPEINLRKLPGGGEIIEKLTVEAAGEFTDALDAPSFGALVIAVRNRQNRELGEAMARAV